MKWNKAMDEIIDFIPLEEIMAVQWDDYEVDRDACNTIMVRCEQGLIHRNNMVDEIHKYFRNKYPGQVGKMLFVRYGLDTFTHGYIAN